MDFLSNMTPSKKERYIGQAANIAKSILARLPGDHLWILTDLRKMLLELSFSIIPIRIRYHCEQWMGITEDHF